MKVGLGIIIVIVGFFAIGVGSVAIWEYSDPEGYQESLEKQERADAIKEQTAATTKRVEKIIKEQARFDPSIVASAKRNIPEMKALPEEILKQCENVNSRADYEIFILALTVQEINLEEILRDIKIALRALEIDGYDEHPEVGPLIYQTRNIAIKTGNCIDEVIRKYG